jgi:hypothetical protein
LAEVENAIVRFEELINVYVSAIEELQSRKDIADVSAEDLTRAVAQMESIVHEWAKIRATLQGVRAQVEIAMEWEELWNNVLGDIQGEMDELSRLVFEMEERRHKGIAAAASGDSVDIGDLETIVEDTPTEHPDLSYEPWLPRHTRHTRRTQPVPGRLEFTSFVRSNAAPEGVPRFSTDATVGLLHAG